MNTISKAGKALVAKANAALKQKERLDRVGAILRGGSGEPTTTQEQYSVDLPMALNWYGLHEDDRKMRKWLVDYLIQNKKQQYLKAVDKAWDVEVKAVCVLVRLMARGQYVSDKDKAFIDTRLNFIQDKYSTSDTSLKVDPKAKPTNVVSIDDRINQAALKHAGEIDEHIDAFIKTKSSDFSTKGYLLSNQISGAVSKRIGEYYAKLERELSEAVAGKCEQLNEGYGYFTKAQLKKFHEFVKGIINDCSQQVVASKVRAPRVRKAKPASVIVAKMKYMKEFTELQLKSVSPVGIVGATELWVYNTKYRRLSVYKADGALSVRGTSILSYDVTASETKTVRKPEEFFKSLSISKRNMATAMKSIKTKPAKPNGRINEEIILLGVF